MELVAVVVELAETQAPLEVTQVQTLEVAVVELLTTLAQTEVELVVLELSFLDTKLEL
jgi:hypothetical protein